MRIIDGTIERAFAAHGRVYADQREWSIPVHVRCWATAAAAFGRGSYEHFERLHGELTTKWQVFRSPIAKPPTPADTWALVGTLNQDWQTRRLQQLNDSNVAGCWEMLNAVSGIKPMKSAPSVVAISKFLHFWNPRMFVIVDDAVMWRQVLSRSWLAAAIEGERKRLEALLPDATCTPSESCELLDYLAVLSWSAGLVRDNPSIAGDFGSYVREAAGNEAGDLPLDEYEGAAVEWLLLGLAELPPPGVEF